MKELYSIIQFFFLANYSEILLTERIQKKTTFNMKILHLAITCEQSVFLLRFIAMRTLPKCKRKNLFSRVRKLAISKQNNTD